jgi:predicted nucleotidyltransferase
MGAGHTREVRHAIRGRDLHDEVARVLAEHLGPSSHRAWIIGSEAAGTALPGSDVDVALEGPAPIDLGVLARLRDALEKLPTIRSFDLVDLRRASDRFRREALATSIELDLGVRRAAHVQG